MDLTVAGTKDAILMVEAGAKEVSEEVMLQAILFAHEEIKKQVAFQEKIAEELGVTKREDIDYYVIPEDIEAAVREFATDKVKAVMDHFDRHERQFAEEQMDAEVLEHFAET